MVSCILRGVNFTPDSYQSFIDYQEKLHLTFCRRRRLVAIGTHDYDTIKGPFLYDARPPAEISFVPLIGKDKDDKSKYTAQELMAIYQVVFPPPAYPFSSKVWPGAHAGV